MRVAILLTLGSLACSFNPPGRCSSRADCTDGTTCREGVCSTCSANADCSAWQFCGGMTLCVSQAGRCTTALDCGAGFYCDSANNCTASTAAGGSPGGGATGGGSAGGGPGYCNNYPPGVSAGSDIISVSGHAGSLGSVYYTTYGSSRTNSSSSRISHATFGKTVGTPAARIFDTGFTLVNKDPLQAGITYQADNSNPYSYVPPYIDFFIDGVIPDPSITCTGSATGQVSLTQFQYPGDGTPLSGVVGTFSYECPNAAISVIGCFRYTRK